MTKIHANVTTASYIKNNVNIQNNNRLQSCKNEPSCTSFKPDTFLFGLLENPGTMVCKPREGATLGEIRKYTGAKKGAISNTNSDIVAKARKDNPKIKLDDIKVSQNDEIKIRETDLPVRDLENGFGLTINGNGVYKIQPGDTKDKIGNFADIEGYPEYNLKPGTIVYVKGEL